MNIVIVDPLEQVVLDSCWGHCGFILFYFILFFFFNFQSELFQDDLYPDTASDTPAISASDFFEGKNAPPVLVCEWILARLMFLCWTFCCLKFLLTIITEN